jgi:hypothetical protein
MGVTIATKLPENIENLAQMPLCSR